MAAQGLDLLAAPRLAGMMRGLQDVRLLPGNLSFLKRTKITPATDGEVMAIVRDYLLAADLIGTGQKAALYGAEQIGLIGTEIPNAKHGRKIDAEKMRLLDQIQNNRAGRADLGIFENYVGDSMDKLLDGIRVTWNYLIAACWVDELTYSKNGFKITGPAWGMPTDLKLTASNYWTDTTLGKPITDILTFIQYSLERYGQVFDRIIMSFTAFRYMIATDQFQAMARFVLPAGQPSSIIPLQDIPYLKNLAQQLLGGITIEFEDSRYWTQESDGSLAAHRVVDITYVVFSNSADDNTDARDLANTVVTESLVGSLLKSVAPGNMIGNFAEPTFGPVGYASWEHNPPEIYLWGVGRAFPRKYHQTATGRLKVGTFTDLVPATEPAFP